MGIESMLDYRLLALVVLLVFYGIYFGKMILQRSRGIKTHQIGSAKEAGRVEKIMSVATCGIVIAQLASVAADWNMITPDARFTGFWIGMAGNLIFFISTYTMRDSWRAGIPQTDKTEFVSRGIYRFSRNPAFLGFDMMYTGVLLMFFNPLLLAFTVFAIVSLHLQILQEEKYLAGRFGAQYDDYRRHVMRYLGRK